MNELSRLDRLQELYNATGLRSEGYGPDAEWSPVSPAEFQRRHNAFWRGVTDVIKSYPGEYDDLPDCMTEVGTEQLEAN